MNSWLRSRILAPLLSTRGRAAAPAGTGLGFFAARFLRSPLPLSAGIGRLHVFVDVERAVALVKSPRAAESLAPLDRLIFPHFYGMTVIAANQVCPEFEEKQLEKVSSSFYYGS